MRSRQTSAVEGGAYRECRGRLGTVRTPGPGSGVGSGRGRQPRPIPSLPGAATGVLHRQGALKAQSIDRAKRLHRDEFARDQTVVRPQLLEGARSSSFATGWRRRYPSCRRSQRRPISSCTYHAVTEETAIAYAALRVTLKRSGRPIPANDAWIAALALQHGVPVRFGILPNFFRSAAAAPELIQQLWGFATPAVGRQRGPSCDDAPRLEGMPSHRWPGPSHPCRTARPRPRRPFDRRPASGWPCSGDIGP